MFNQLSPAEVVTAIGVTARRAARSEGQASAFDRDQLMSAYSATRHLSAELTSYPSELRRFTDSLVRTLGATGDAALDEQLAPIVALLESEPAIAVIADSVCDALQTLREAPGAAGAALTTELRGHLRTLADREVDVLADALG